MAGGGQRLGGSTSRAPRAEEVFGFLGFWFCFVLFCFCFFLGLHPGHMEVLRLGGKSELHLLAYTTATQDPSLVYDLYHSSQQHRILNPLGEARDQTHNLIVPSQIHFHCAMMGTYGVWFFDFFSFLATPRHMEFPGQGSDSSHSLDLSHSGSSAGSLSTVLGCPAS